MKGLILSGGLGMRLRPLSYAMPKQLVPVANRPVLDYVVENVRRLGVSEIGVVAGDWGPQIAAAMGHERFGAKITYIPQDRPRGLAHCVQVARDFLGQDDFAVWLGDSLLLDGVGEIAAEFTQARPAAQVVVSKVTDPRQFGVAELGPDGSVQRLTEKPGEPRSDLALTGVYFFTPAIHQAVGAIVPSARGELELTDAVQWLLDHGHQVTASRYEGFWQDAGRPADVLACNRRVLAGLAGAIGGQVDGGHIRGQVVVETGATVRRSTLQGPVLIGAGSVVEDSHLGPNVSIGRCCRLAGARLSDSIVLDEAVITAPHLLTGSLIGRGATVGRTSWDAGHRLLLSDHADVTLPTLQAGPRP
ncbi:MAG TPA: glucose-1-phosphate thymidylyltransferase [Streptosporangiaceae bacterium]|jgi:glucose-1-phosphate thymidylyltransferase